MLGFFFASIVAIHLSTVSTQLNLGAVYATRDLYHHYINPKATEKRLILVGRISTLIILIGSFIYGMMMTEEITKYLLFALWIMAAGVWLPNILQVVWWRFNSWAYLSSWIANLIAVRELAPGRARPCIRNTTNSCNMRVSLILNYDCH